MMGLRKSACPRFTLLRPFTAHPYSTLMHLFICGGLPYSFKHVLFHTRLVFFTPHFALLHHPWPICTCDSLHIHIFFGSAFLRNDNKKKKTPNPGSYYASKI